jgi:aromatic ring-opening dioxygenase LigB subunit
MAENKTWAWAALVPHPPIIVPGVGGGREKEAAVTLAGVAELMKRLKALGTPDRILLLSPHQPCVPGAFAINGAPSIKGGLSLFGAPDASFELRPPAEDVNALAAHLRSKGVPAVPTADGSLAQDQGSAVPLYFLEKNYGKLPGLVLSSPIGLGGKLSLELGRALASFGDGRRWGLLASGDLSHRLKPGAPAGFSPAGALFDKTAVGCLESTDASALLALPDKTVADAGECGMRPVIAMIGLVSELRGRIDVLSYEGPYGVGYCNAVAALNGGLSIR